MKLQQTIRNKYSVALTAAAMLFLMLPLICAAQGKIAFHTSRDGNYEVYKMNPDGTSQVNLTNHPSYDSNPSFNGSGSKIAFISSRDGNHDVFSMNADGSNQINLTNNPAYDSFPSFCPSGSKIAFTSRRAGNDEIYVMNPDGSNQIRLTFEDPAVDFMPAFSPDCSKIAFVSDRDGDNEIYVMNADGTNQIRLTNNTFGDSNPKFSADGTKIVFSSSRGSGAQIHIMDADGSYQVAVTHGENGNNHYPALSPDGTKVAYVKTDEIYVTNLDGTNDVNLTSNDTYEFAPTWGREPGNNFSLLTLSDLLSQDAEPNRATAGNSVPIDFRLGGFRGSSVYSSPPSSQRIDCANRRPLGTAEPINRTQPDVVYNTGLEYYSTTWLTPTAWRGTCRRLFLNLNEDTTRMLDFYFQ